MKNAAVLLSTLLALAGCAGPTGYAVVRSNASCMRQGNLALGPSREHARLSQQFTARTDWPAAPNGVHGDDITFYTTIIYDQQSFNDRYNSFYRETQSIRTGVWMR